MYQVRQILSYGAVFGFVIFIIYDGFANSLLKVPLSVANVLNGLQPSNMDGNVGPAMPDICHFNPLAILSAKDFPLDDPTRKIIVVGDIHGMMKSLQNLLKRVDYRSSSDVLIHLGDIITKSSVENSLAVLEFMAANNITGVRGNHDQQVIEWRSWIGWIETIPQAFKWLKWLEKEWSKAQAIDDISLDYWLRKQKRVASQQEKVWWKLVPKQLDLFDDHYIVARDISEAQFEYLRSLPLRLYIPSAHTFIVHAGVLPYNPEYPVDDQSNQPLARIPKLLSHDERHLDNNSNTTGTDYFTFTPITKDKIEQLRNLQEMDVLTHIPQNQNPWVTLNMRSVQSNGKISKKASNGKAWSKIWKQTMESCVGYERKFSFSRSPDVAIGEDEDESASDSGLNIHGLPCYPSTTIYGHAAGRGLDIKRWSFGLDTGCVYKKRLTAMIIKSHKNTNVIDEDGDDDDDSISGEILDDGELDEESHGDLDANKRKTVPFGDHHAAKIVSVRCR